VRGSSRGSATKSGGDETTAATGYKSPFQNKQSTKHHPPHLPTPAAYLVLHAQHTPQHNTPPHAENMHHQPHSRGHVTSTPHRKHHKHTLPLLLEDKLPPLIIIVVLSTTTVLTALPLVLPHGAPVRWKHRASRTRQGAWRRPSSSAHTGCDGAEHVREVAGAARLNACSHSVQALLSNPRVT